MNVIVWSDPRRINKFLDMPDVTFVFPKRDAELEEIAAEIKDGEVIIVDAVGYVSEAIMDVMPNLRLIHSEGVGYNQIDVKAAEKRNIYVCNNKAANAESVAEHTLLLMLGALRDIYLGHRNVFLGKQIEHKETAILEGIQELGESTIGFVGFGDIAKTTARHLQSFTQSLYYYSRTQYDTDLAEYLPLDELLERCDIVSLHLPLSDDTYHIVNADFLGKMKPGSILINTARGDLIDYDALIDALNSGQISRVALDTLSPEPVQRNHPLLNLVDDVQERVLFSPHIGGVSNASFKKIYRNIKENIEALQAGTPLKNVVSDNEEY